MIEEIGNIDEASMWIELPASVCVWRAEERLRARGLTLGPQPPSVLRRSVREWLEGPYAGRWVEGGRLAPCVAAIKVRLEDGSVVRTFPAPRSALGPSLEHIFLGSQGSRGEILSAVLRARRTSRKKVELTYRGGPSAVARWLVFESRRILLPLAAEIIGGEEVACSLMYSADSELERARLEAAAEAARTLGLARTDTPGQLSSERDWESEIPSDAWENLIAAVPNGHRIWLTRIARESAVAIASRLTGEHLPVLVEPTLDIDHLDERLTSILRPH